MRPVANETREVVTALRTYGVTSPPHPDGAGIGPDSAQEMGEVWEISDPLDADGNRVGRECPEVLDVLSLIHISEPTRPY